MAYSQQQQKVRLEIDQYLAFMESLGKPLTEVKVNPHQFQQLGEPETYRGLKVVVVR